MCGIKFNITPNRKLSAKTCSKKCMGISFVNTLRKGPNKIRKIGKVCFMEMYDAKGNVKAITKFDSCFREKVSKKRWAIYRNYAFCNYHGKYISLHRFILNYVGKRDVDHINMNKLDNRKINLRIVGHYINCLNNKSHGCSYHRKTNTWRSYFVYKGKQKSLGYFKHKKDAIKAKKDVIRKILNKYNATTRSNNK